MELPSLQSICQFKIIEVLKESGFHGRMVNDLCKYAPDHLLEPIFIRLLEKGVITEVALMAYLVPNRVRLKIVQARNIRNSIFKQIGLNCPNLVNLDLTDCSQVTNSVVRAILQGCPVLEDVRLDGCHKITDSAFDFSESPFQALRGCLSLKSISLQGCPQITGDIINTLNKHCRKLNFLNLSQCKNVKSPSIQQVFQHRELKSLNLGFIEDISDEAFILLAPPAIQGTGASNWPVARSPLQALNLCKSRITDSSIDRMACLFALLEIHLQWCAGITEAGIISLARNCRQLRLLDLKSCPSVTDHALGSIADLCRDLKVLDVSWCTGFSEDGLLQLVPLVAEDSSAYEEEVAGTICLEQLYFEWCMQVTDRTLYALQTVASLKLVHLVGCSALSPAAILALKNCNKQIFS